MSERLTQIMFHAIRVRPTDVGRFEVIKDGPISPADSVLIAPADLAWMVAQLRNATTPAPTSDGAA